MKQNLEHFRAKQLGSIALILASNGYRKVEETWEKNPANFPGHNSHILRSYDPTTKRLHGYQIHEY